MRRLSLAVCLARHALSKASSSPACLNLEYASSSLVPHSFSLACPPAALPHASPRFASSSRGLPNPSRNKPTGTAVLREDGIALADILEHHADLEELSVDFNFRQQPNAQSTSTSGKAAASQARIPEAEAAQRAADDLFDTELAARMMQVASQRMDAPTQSSTSDTSTSSTQTGLLRSTNNASTSGRRSRVPSHPYAPPYDIYEARRDIEQTLKKMLARAGYYKRDLLDPRSLSLLKPTQLAEVCEDCGIPAPKGTTPAQLAQAVANLVALARQDSSRPSHTSTFTHTAEAPKPIFPEGLQEKDVEEDEDKIEEEEEETTDTTISSVPPPMPSLAATAEGGESTGRGLRAQVLQEARYRQHVLQLIASHRKISSWLVAARAQDAVVVYPVNSESHTSVLIVATAVSQRHAAACVEAVRWQVSEALKSMSAAASPGSREAGVLSSMSAPPAVGVGVGSDWVALDAGHAEVHVLTPAARAYYQLEASFGQSDGSIDRLQPSQGQARLQRISQRPGAVTPSLTLDNIRAEEGQEPDEQPSTAAASMHVDCFHPVSSQSSSWKGRERQMSGVGSEVFNQRDDESHAWQEAGSGGEHNSQHQTTARDAGAGSVWQSGGRVAQTQASGEPGGRADHQKDGSKNDTVAGTRRDMRRPLFGEL